MATMLPGMEMAASSPPAEQVRTNGFELRDIVNLYLQQSAAVNQLWAMYAATSFVAAGFAFTVGSGSNSAWLLIPGMLGFAFFTFGHANMVRYTLQRMHHASEDVARLLKASSEPPESQPSVLAHLAAHEVGIAGAMAIHIAIDLCVFGAFGLQLGLWLGWR